MVLDEHEIPGGAWYLQNDRSWRVGTFSRSDPVLGRAHEAGTFVRVRVFERIKSKQRLLLQIIPTASIGDAELMLSDMESLLERGRKGKGNVLGTRVLRDHDVPGVVNAWVYEIEGTGRGHNRSLVGRHIAGTVRHVLFVVETLGYIEPWSWTDVDAVATRQKEKVERTLATSEGGD